MRRTKAFVLFAALSTVLIPGASAPASAQESDFPTYGTPYQKYLWARKNLPEFCNITPGPHMTYNKLPREIRLELVVATESMVVQRVMENCSFLQAMNTAQ